MDTTEARLAPEPSPTAISWTDRAEAAGAALFFAAMRTLPLDLASSFGGWLGRRIGPWLGVSRRARHNLAAALPELQRARARGGAARHVGQSRPGRGGISASPAHSGVRPGRPGRDPRPRASRRGDRGRAAGDRLRRPSRQLGDRRAGRRAIRHRRRADLPRRQQPAGRPHGGAVSRHRQRVHPEGRRRLAPGLGGVAARRPSDPAGRPEAQRRHRGAVFRPAGDDRPGAGDAGLAFRLRGIAGAGRAAAAAPGFG